MLTGLPPLTKTSRCEGKVYGIRTGPENWSPKDDIKEFPTNGFGQIKFVNAYSSFLTPAKV